MTNAPVSWPVVKTQIDWCRPLGLDPRQVFYDLTGALVSLSKKEWEDHAQKAWEKVDLGKVGDDPAQMAFGLLLRALTRTVFSLAREVLPRLVRLAPEDQQGLIDSLEFPNFQDPMVLGPEFFEHPQSQGKIPIFKRPFITWLTGLGLPEPLANAVWKRFPGYYRFFLDEEWQTRGRDWACLSRTMMTPFFERDTMERAWRSYDLYLEKCILKPYFGEEVFGLADMFVPPRAWHQAGGHKVAGDLARTLTAWLSEPEESGRFGMIVGQPGLGQKVFAAMFASQVSKKQEYRVLSVPLHHFPFSGTLEHDLNRFFLTRHFFPQRPLNDESDRKPLLLIFHGLSELPFEKAGLADQMRRFLAQAVELANRLEHQGRRVRILLTSWEEQSLQIRQRLPGDTRVHHLLPMWIGPDDRKGYQDPERLLSLDFRDLWWKKYGETTGRGYTELPQIIKDSGPRFDPLTVHPLRSYLLALALERNPEGLADIRERRVLLVDYFKQAYDRIFDERRPYRWVYFIEPERLFFLLKEVAVTLWHGRNHGATANDLRKGLGQEWNRDLDALFELARSGVLGFLTLRETSAGNPEEVLSFFHQNLSSYLAAHRVLDELEALDQEMAWHRETPLLGLDEESALARWARSCGPVAMEPEMLLFFGSHLKDMDPQKVEGLHLLAVRLLSHLIEKGVPMTRLGLNMDFQEMVRQARNLEETLLGVHYSLARTIGQRGLVAWPSETAAGEMIRRLAGQRSGPETRLALSCLGYLNLDRCRLDAIDLAGARLVQSSLNQAVLESAILTRTDLSDAEMIQADLTFADLRKARLKRTVLRKSDLTRALLTRADLSEADLGQALLTQADLRQIKAVRADFSGADLSDADLSGADLEGASFQGAVLNNANLTGANLKNADLAFADLEGARLDQADLSWTVLEHPLQ